MPDANDNITISAQGMEQSVITSIEVYIGLG